MILICSDFHINKSNRLEDTIDSMNQILEYCKDKNNKINHVIFEGDAYHTRKPSQVEQRIFEKWSYEIKSLGIKQIYLLGNHDRDKDTNTLGVYSSLKIEGIEVVDRETVLEFGDFKLFIGHLQIKEAKIGALNYIIPCSFNTRQLLEKYKADMYIMGHIHKPQIIKKNPAVIYVGSIERVDFAERNEKKYFIVIDPKKKLYKFFNLNIRPMIQYDNISCKEDLANILLDVNKGNKKPIIKLIINKDMITKYSDVLQIIKDSSYSCTIIQEKNRAKKRKTSSISDINNIQDNFKKYCKIKEYSDEILKEGLKILK